MIEYCMSTKCIDTASIKDKLAAIGSAGFDSVELWYCDVVGMAVPELRKMIADSGLRVAEVVKLEGWFELDGGLMGVSNNEVAIIDECKRRMDLAAQLDCKYIVALPSRDDRGFLAEMCAGLDRYRQLLDIGQSMGVKPTLEFIGQSSQIKTIVDAVDCIRRVDHPWASMIIDVFHLWRSGGEIEDIAVAKGISVSLLHLHDVTADYPRFQYKDRHRVMPGDGILDLKGFLTAAKELGFDGPISLGAYNHDYWVKDPFEVAREGYHKMKNVIGQVFQ